MPTAKSAKRVTAPEHEPLPSELDGLSTIELGRRHLAGTGVAAHRAAAAARDSKPKANGKLKKWGCDFAPGGEPRWCCPNCLAMVIQSVCPEVCKGCGEHGDPAQSFKPPAADTNPPKGETKPAAGETMERIHEIDRRLICGHPDNPRQHFDQAKLEEFAAGLGKVGVINPLTVRAFPVDQAAACGFSKSAISDLPASSVVYQLVAGERRLRAAKIARLGTVPCRIVDITDEEAYEVMIRENLDREDLDEIEKARSYQLGLEKCGLSQEAFAKRYKKSQEHVSNTIRLLALPEAWQQRLIQRQITATHARELLAWVDVPAVLEKLNKGFDPKDVPSAKEFHQEVLDAVRGASRSMTFNGYDFGGGCRFKPTPAQAKELDIREVPRSWGGKERRAFNTKLYAELNGAAKKRREQKKATATAGATRDRASMQAENERREFGRALFGHKHAWVAHQVANRLTQADGDLAWKTCVIAIWEGDVCEQLQDPLAKALGARSHVEAELRAAVSGRSLVEIGTQLVEALRAALLAVDEEWNRYNGFSPEWLGHLATHLKVDLSKQWTPTEAFVEIFDEKRRKELIVEGDFALNNTDMMLQAWPKGFVPQALLWVNEHGDIKRPKGPKAAKSKALKKAKAKR